ncbi:MAG TPA: hypothetical protein PK042_03280 [Usitatibacteraceae bacterium]|nr:hypothetical protein [Usitatibacteraceae bacterium]
MFRAFIVSGFLALGLYGFAQYRGWSVFGSDAEEFQRARAERAYARSFGGTGSSSGHK